MRVAKGFLHAVLLLILRIRGGHPDPPKIVRLRSGFIELKEEAFDASLYPTADLQPCHLPCADSAQVEAQMGLEDGQQIFLMSFRDLTGRQALVLQLNQSMQTIISGYIQDNTFVVVCPKYVAVLAAMLDGVLVNIYQPRYKARIYIVIIFT
jgi:hypothetical protein